MLNSCYINVYYNHGTQIVGPKIVVIRGTSVLNKCYAIVDNNRSIMNNIVDIKGNKKKKLNFQCLKNNSYVLLYIHKWFDSKILKY